jgi:hypothetical protein
MDALDKAQSIAQEVVDHLDDADPEIATAARTTLQDASLALDRKLEATLTPTQAAQFTILLGSPEVVVYRLGTARPIRSGSTRKPAAGSAAE